MDEISDSVLLQPSLVEGRIAIKASAKRIGIKVFKRISFTLSPSLPAFGITSVFGT